MYKRCSRCGNRIEYSQKCICSKKSIKNNYKNDLEKKFYSSKNWQNIVEISKKRYNYLDIYSYYILGRIEEGEVVHHIVPLTENWNKKLDIKNLIFLTEKNHRTIHNLMKKGFEDKANTQQLLYSLIERFNKDFEKGWGCK